MIARFLLPVAALLLILFDCGTSYAQAQICNQLNNQLRQLERNGDFRSGQRNAQKANALQADLQNAESEYVRRGCNDAAKAGQQLSRQCQGLARTIIKGREQLANLSQDVDTASAISQQREAVLQDISRFGCNTRNSNVNVNNGSRGTLFERLFGGYTQEENPYGDGNIVDDGTQGYDGYYGGGGTVRTVCVRLSDGYFWPISYSTLPQYVSNDAVQCQEQCPGTPVDLYYYGNPGQEEEQMINMAGEQYINLPNAFAYRKAFDMNAVCKPKDNSGGFMTIAGGDMSAPTPDGAGGQTVDFNAANIPLPKPDPRRQGQALAAPMQVATALNVPLPRPRPGSDDPTVSQAIAQPQATNENRVVTFGDKKVRIVGPDTPYAQVVAAGT